MERKNPTNFGPQSDKGFAAEQILRILAARNAFLRAQKKTAEKLQETPEDNEHRPQCGPSLRAVN